MEEQREQADAKPSDLHSTMHTDTERTTATHADVIDPATTPSPGEVTDSGEAWQQVARAVRSVHRDEDGNHTMTVRLDPPELGTVEQDRLLAQRDREFGVLDRAPGRRVPGRQRVEPGEVRRRRGVDPVRG